MESEAAKRQVRHWLVGDKADAVLIVEEEGPDPDHGEGPPSEAGVACANITCRVYSAQARDGSAQAAARLEELLEEFRVTRLEKLATATGGDESLLNVLSVERKDSSSRRELMNYLASLILPLVMVLMTVVGALYPALDTTVGEKERGTLETTLVSPASRLSLVLGKYAAIVAFSLAAFLLNFGSMWFTLSHLLSNLQEQMGMKAGLEGFSLSWGALLLILVAAIPLALLLAALMMVLGFMARSFKEGQSYVAPVYVLAVVPAVFTSSPDLEGTLVLAVTPVLNISLLFRDVLQGDFSWLGIALTLCTSAVYALVALLLAARLLRQEELSSGGNLSLRQALDALLGRRHDS
jgi:ABC-type Na+ efflux pump permease subunit